MMIIQHQPYIVVVTTVSLSKEFPDQGALKHLRMLYLTSSTAPRTIQDLDDYPKVNINELQAYCIDRLISDSFC